MNGRKHVDNFLEHYGTSIAPDTDYLQHWKYIKRERKKGKWVYTYPDDKNGKTGGVKDVAKNVATKVKDKLGLDEKANVEATRKELSKAASERAKAEKKSYEAYKKADKDGTVTEREYREMERADNAYYKTIEKSIEANRKYVEAKEKYSKTPIAKAEKAVEKGKSIATKIVDTFTKPAQIFKRDEAKQENNSKEISPNVPETEREPKMPTNPIPGLDLKTDETTRDEDMSIVNPEYSRDPENLYNENCAYCTLAYDLRRRGYDVEAGAEIDNDNDGHGDGMTPMEILECYENTSYDENVVDVNDLAEKYNAAYTVESMTNAMEKDMLSQGEGARGHLCLYWAQGGGHDVIWEVENGKVVVRDCQTNEKLNLMDYTQYCNNFGYIRTDNLTPNDNCKKYVRNRRG